MYKYFLASVILISVNIYSENLNNKIITAKEIVTLDPVYKNVEAIYIRNNKIHALGTSRELVKQFPSAQVDNKHKNHVIVPGFIEHHIHPLLAAITMNSEIVAIDDWTVLDKKSVGVRTREAYIKKLSDVISNKDGNQPIVTWGFHHYFHGKLTRENLDSISQDKPILVIHRSFHEFILNTAALNFFNISAEDLINLSEEDRKFANIDEGHFSERGLIAVMPKIMKYLAEPARIISGLQKTEEYIHKNGITLIANPGSMYDKNIQQVKNYVFGDIDTPFRSLYIPSALYMLENVNFHNLLEKTEEQLLWGSGKVEFLPKHIKLFSDGAMYSQNMMLRDGYLDGHQGAWLMEDAVFQETFKLYWDNGYQIHIHQNGDAGLDRILDVLERNLKRKPRINHRTTIVHFGYSAYDQIERMKNLGVIVSANPYYVDVLSDLYSRKGVGYERSQEMVRLGDVLDANITLSLHSDMPMAPASPLALMHSAINRINYSGLVAGPNQQITAYEALKAVTLNSAYTLGIENDYGSITPAKNANFTILSANPLTIDSLDIKNIKIIGTIVEGRFFSIP